MWGNEIDELNNVINVGDQIEGEEEVMDTTFQYSTHEGWEGRGVGGGGDLISPSDINPEDPSLILNNLRIKNSEKIIVVHLNINHINNKFKPLLYIIAQLACS